MIFYMEHVFFVDVNEFCCLRVSHDVRQCLRVNHDVSVSVVC